MLSDILLVPVSLIEMRSKCFPLHNEIALALIFTKFHLNTASSIAIA